MVGAMVAVLRDAAPLSYLAANLKLYFHTVQHHTDNITPALSTFHSTVLG